MTTGWYLEGFEIQSQRFVRAAVRSLPFSVGRRSGCDLSINSKMVSQRHAEFFERAGSLWLRDLGSTNGTFVNGQRLVGEHHLGEGDILHFADLEYKLVRNMAREEASWPALTKTMNLKDLDLPGGGIARFRQVRELVKSEAVDALFQPLVHLGNGSVLGYEALGRGAFEDAPISPGELFKTAETIGLESDLSVIFRNKGLENARRLPNPPKIFLNTHPAELQDHQALLATLEALRLERPSFGVVLEIHESAVTDIASLKDLRCELEKLGIGIAFDDFGTGQTRILELAEASPHYLKFDAKLIRDIHLESKKKQRDMVRSLVQLIADLEIVVIAEGIEQLEEAKTCHRLGFEYGQGFLFGRPAAAATFLEESYETETP